MVHHVWFCPLLDARCLEVIVWMPSQKLYEVELCATTSVSAADRFLPFGLLRFKCLDKIKSQFDHSHKDIMKVGLLYLSW